AKKSNEMYYPRFTKVIINFFMTKDPSIPRNSAAYKEYYTIASGAAPPKTKESVRKTQSSSDTTMPPSTTAGTVLLNLAKGKQPAKSSKAKGADEETGIIPGVPDDVDYQDEGDNDDDQDEGHDDDQDTDEEGEEFIHSKLSIHDEEETKEESFDPIAKMPENSDDEGNDDENIGLNVGREEGQDAKDDEDELYKDVNINLEGRVVQMADVHTTQEFEECHVTLTPVNPDGQQQINVAVQIQSDKLRDEAQAKNEEFLKNLDENIQKIIKEQVKEQVKILIEKMEGNKSIHRSDEQRNLYKALVEAYESDKIILDTYGDIVTLKRRQDDDADKDEEYSIGSDRGSKRLLLERIRAPRDSCMTPSSAHKSESQLALLVRLSTVECFHEWPAKFRSNHDQELEVSFVAETIQDDEKLLQ
nr:hypothetical protein [Tanacetum cinerariifolium]